VGNFYTNITVRGPSQDDVADALKGRETLVTPALDGCVVVYDEPSESQDPAVLADLAKMLSKRFNCPAFAVLNHDDDVLLCTLFENGTQRDRYDSTPGFEGGDDPFAPPEGGDARILCAAFGSSKVAEVSEILRATRDTYMFAVMRHADLVAALGLPECTVSAGFNYLSEGEVPESLDDVELIATS
jgi:hypothetical protein